MLYDQTQFLSELMRQSNPILLSVIRKTEKFLENNETMDFQKQKYKNYCIKAYEELVADEK